MGKWVRGSYGLATRSGLLGEALTSGDDPE